MKFLFSFVAIGMALFMVSCNNNSGQDDDSWAKERDSLQTVNAQQQTLINDMTTTMADISASLDTIAKYEGMIVRRIDENGHPLSKQDLKSRLSTLSDIIRNQREKMEVMEKSISEGKSSIGKLKSIISYLSASLEQREAEIQKLRREVDSKNFSIARLNTRVAHLKDTVASVRQENEERLQQIESQKEQHQMVLNEVFYVVGTKEQLINTGVLSKSGTFLKKKKINFASIDKSMLTKADRRTLKQIKIQGKSPKMLSDAPKGTYALEKNGTTSTLTILDTDKFWSANNKILVIQVK